MTPVYRYDAAGVLNSDKITRTPQGGLRIPARFTRTGVLPYKLPDGSTRREYRPPEEVFAPESIRTLIEAPVTHLHPQEGKVDSASYSRLNKGQVSTDVGPEGERFLAGTAVVQDADTVSLVEQRALQELSAGYTCTLEPTPGTTPEGEPYDVVQRGIRYNHVALLPRGQGRAGPEVSLRLDSQGHQLMPPEPTEEIKMELTPEELASLKSLAAIAPKLAALVTASETPVAPVPAPVVVTDSPAVPAAAPMAAPVQQKVDGKEKPAVPALTKEQLAAANERLVNDSIEIREKARGVLGGEAVFTGKSNKEIMSAVITHVDDKFAIAGKSDEAIAAVFDMALARHAERADSKSELGQVQLSTHVDASDIDDKGAPTTVGGYLAKNIAAASRK